MIMIRQMMKSPNANLDRDDYLMTIKPVFILWRMEGRKENRTHLTSLRVIKMGHQVPTLSYHIEWTAINGNTHVYERWIVLNIVCNAIKFIGNLETIDDSNIIAVITATSTKHFLLKNLRCNMHTLTHGQWLKQPINQCKDTLTRRLVGWLWHRVPFVGPSNWMGGSILILNDW